MQKYLPIYFVLLSMLVFPKLVFGQITGRVFDNGNSTGKTSHAERPIAGLSIKAYGMLEPGKYELISQTQSDAKGQYFLNVSEGKKVKIVFEGKLKNLQSNESTPAVTFVTSPASEVNWGGYRPIQYVSNNPYLVSPVYINGKGNDSLTALKAISLEDTISFSLASSSQVGALWAVAFNKYNNQLYSAAFAKRHVGFGPLGSGGIYRTDWDTKATTPWLDLKTIGILTGDDHHLGLKASVDSNSTDGLLMADVGKLGLGGMDISEDGKVLYVMNLYNSTLYAINLPSDTAARPISSDVTSFVIPVSKNKGGTMRPFAVKAYEGKIYVGTVCDAEKSQMVTDLSASVYVLDTITKRFTLLFSMPMDYTRGKAVNGLNVESWYPWTDDFSQALHTDFPSTATRPQPVLSSIAFDVSGAMVLGFMDRFGHQSGTGQPEPGGKASYSGVAAGDVLRVYPRKPGNTNPKFRLETNAVAGAVSSEGKGNLQGPQGGEFFFQDGFTYKDEKRNARIVHEETGAGGLVILPGTEEVLMTAHEPTETFNSGGIKSFFAEDGKTNRGWLLYTDGQMGTFGKANGVGGLAIISELPGIAAGNRIWSDGNGNGIQDPDEPAIPNVALELWQKDAKLGHTISDSEGNYLFNEENVRDGLKPDTDYQIRINLKEKGLKASLFKSTTDSEVDNDGIEVNGYAVAAFRTGKVGENMHSLDFGFLPERKQSEIKETDGSFVVYPNPVVSNLEVKVKAYEQSAIIRLIDLTGRTLQIKKVDAKDGMYKTSLVLTGISAGNYIISVDEKGTVRTAVVMKQ